jgi:hypothetical protein
MLVMIPFGDCITMCYLEYKDRTNQSKKGKLAQAKIVMHHPYF